MSTPIDQVLKEVFTPEFESACAERNVVECNDEHGTYFEVQDGFGNQVHVADSLEQVARSLSYEK